MASPSKLTMWQSRLGLCDFCGGEMNPTDLDCHIHHALVYRNELPRSKQHTDAGSIDEQINLMLIHANGCHDALQCDRQWAYEYKVAEWGERAVTDFLRRMKPKTFVREQR